MSLLKHQFTGESVAVSLLKQLLTPGADLRAWMLLVARMRRNADDAIPAPLMVPMAGTAGLPSGKADKAA